MKMNIKKVELIYDLGQDIPSNYGEKLRGYFANRFKEVLFHNHNEDGNFRYGYPLIQYKIIKNRPVIVGMSSIVEIAPPVSLSSSLAMCSVSGKVESPCQTK